MKYEKNIIAALGFMAMSSIFTANAQAQEASAARPDVVVDRPGISGPVIFGPDVSRPDIPNPADFEVTRENYDRVVSMLAGKGLNRKQIKRWINASLGAHADRPDRPMPTARVKVAKNDVRAVLADRRTRPEPVVRTVRQVKPVRVTTRPLQRVQRPVKRPVRPQTRRTGG